MVWNEEDDIDKKGPVQYRKGTGVWTKLGPVAKKHCVSNEYLRKFTLTSAKYKQKGISTLDVVQT